MRLEEGQVITFHRRYLRVIDGDIDAGDGGGTGDSGIGSDSGDAGEGGASVSLGDNNAVLIRELTDRLLAAESDCGGRDGDRNQQALGGDGVGANDDSPGAITDGTVNGDTHRRVFSYTLLWDGERRHKVTTVNACKQVNIGPRISSNRLDRVKQAQKQLQANKSAALAPIGTVDSTAAASGGVTEVQVDKAVVENGSDLAFAMNEGGKLTLWIGRIEIMSGRKKIP